MSKAKRTMRGGVRLANASTESGYVVRLYCRSKLVVSFRHNGAEADAIAAGFERVARNLASTLRVYPKCGIVESDYAVTLQPRTLTLGDETQATRRYASKGAGNA